MTKEQKYELSINMLDLLLHYWISEEEMIDLGAAYQEIMAVIEAHA